MLVELLRAASRDDEAREQLEKMAAELEARGDRDGARATRERLQAIDIELPDDSPQPAPASKNDLIFLDTGFTTPSRPVPPAPGLDRPPVVPQEVIAPADGFIAPEPLELDEPVAPLDIMPEEATLEASPDIETLDDLESAIADRVAAQTHPLDGLVLDSAAELDDTFRDEDFIVPDDDLGIERPTPVDLAFDGTGESDLELDPPAGTPLTEAELYEEDGDSSELVLDYSGTDANDFGVATPSAVDQSFADATAAEGLWHSEAVEADAEIGEEAIAPELPYIEGADPVHLMTAPDELAQPATVALSSASIVDLEEAVLDDPQNPSHHRALADALLTNDEAERAREEYELALEGFAQQESWANALDAVDALIWLDPDSIRYQQKRVEMAFRSGDRARLLDAYLHLGDTLAREGAIDKALAVYGRVLEHEPENVRALQGIALLETPAPPPAPAAPTSGAFAAPPAVPGQQRPAAQSAPPQAEPPPAEPSPVPGTPGFIDLGSMILDREIKRDTRMRVESERPTGDEQRDFQETLAQFKRGIEENLGSEDYETHYDLGVAFREMGLLDEAIAEFQKALRAPDGRLRTSEALGLTFFDKGQFAIAESILSRAVEGGEADDEKIGAFYWLGRSAEAQDKRDEAIAAYERALAVDIRFRDLSERIHRLGAGRAR
jgi:tetratricopeptide (TPR) repeat protein